MSAIRRYSTLHVYKIYTTILISGDFRHSCMVFAVGRYSLKLIEYNNVHPTMHLLCIATSCHNVGRGSTDDEWHAFFNWEFFVTLSRLYCCKTYAAANVSTCGSTIHSFPARELWRRKSTILNLISVVTRFLVLNCPTTSGFNSRERRYCLHITMSRGLRW